MSGTFAIAVVRDQVDRRGRRQFSLGEQGDPPVTVPAILDPASGSSHVAEVTLPAGRHQAGWAGGDRRGPNGCSRGSRVSPVVAGEELAVTLPRASPRRPSPHACPTAKSVAVSLEQLGGHPVAV